jgi:hypothetical protein
MYVPRKGTAQGVGRWRVQLPQPFQMESTSRTEGELLWHPVLGYMPAAPSRHVLGFAARPGSISRPSLVPTKPLVPMLHPSIQLHPLHVCRTTHFRDGLIPRRHPSLLIQLSGISLRLIFWICMNRDSVNSFPVQSIGINQFCGTRTFWAWNTHGRHKYVLYESLNTNVSQAF